MNGVKNIEQFHGKTKEELKSLNFRHLMAILVSSRGRIICSCGKGHHCGDDVLEQHERDWNKKQRELYENVKDVLKEHFGTFNRHQIKK